MLFVLSTKTTKEISAKAVSAKRKLKNNQPFLSCIELTVLVQQGNPQHTEYSLRIIYNLQFEESNFRFDIYSFVSLLLLNKNNTWRPTCFIILNALNP